MSNFAADAWQLSDTEVFTKYGDAFVPRRREQIQAVCALLSNIPDHAVLDLCCGEGRLSEEFLSTDDQGRVTLLDGSAEMLALANERLRPYVGRFDQDQADIKDRSWRKPATYGAVMTSLAVHHLNEDEKQALYRDVHEMLIPGGCFVMADLVEPTSVDTRNLAGDHWHEAVSASSRTLFSSEEATEVFEQTDWNYFRLTEPDPLDKPSTVIDHIDWLRAAGFDEVDVPWVYAGHAIIFARRKAA